jgi:hypothetical protein
MNLFTLFSMLLSTPAPGYMNVQVERDPQVPNFAYL